MTNTTLTVDNPLGLFDGCWVKLESGDIVGPLTWDRYACMFLGQGTHDKWYGYGKKVDSLGPNIISLAPPREPVKVPEPWTVWNYFYGSYFGEVWKTKEDAIAARAKSAWVHLLEIECRVIRVHFPDGTTQEVE